MSYRVLIAGVGLLAVFAVLDAWGTDADRAPGDASPSGPGPEAVVPPGHPANGALSGSQENELLEALKKRSPERHAALMRLKEQNLRAYRHALRLYWRMYERLKGAPKEVQDAWVNLTETRTEIARTLQEFNKAGQAEKPALKDKLRALLARQLEAEHVVHRHRLAMLEKEIEELRAQLKRQAENREQIINQRLEHLLEAPTGDRPTSRPHPPRPLEKLPHPDAR